MNEGATQHTATPSAPHPASFRDPAGFVFRDNGILYRQVNRSFAQAFEAFESSGACARFIEKKWLVPHHKTSDPIRHDSEAAFFLQPVEIPFISYPYEWSFEMLRDAALHTLTLAEACLDYQLQLKDASPFNIQFMEGRPIFIDSLSFEPLQPGPWVAYRQFCQSFLAPLLLMHYSRRPAPELFRAWPDGIALPLAAKWLPWRSRFSIHSYLHIHLQAKLSQKTTNRQAKESGSFGPEKLKRILLSLRTLIQSLRKPDDGSVWSGYYAEAGNRGSYLAEKQTILAGWFNKMNGLRKAIDLGANEGLFSGMLAERKVAVVAADIDPVCVDRLYARAGETGIHPLVQDLANPSPGIGALNTERAPFLERARADLALALALIHHLALEKKMSLAMIRDLFLPMAPNLIVEFVPAEDEKAALLLQRIEGLKPAYSQEAFEACFAENYEIHQRIPVGGSLRTLYWLKRK